MKTYVFDTAAFITLGQWPKSIFPGFWKRLDSYAGTLQIVSVHEARRELDQKNARQDLKDWIAANKAIFNKPNEDELACVADVFKQPHFLQLVGKQQMLGGMPVADPFVIAAGRVHGHCVVTQEKHKPNAAKIPNVCQHFKVPCIGLEEFCASEGWRFD